ncbi:MAG: choice-of-anchor D domain-containing protein, partial [Terracidiphilus sp.]
TDNATNTPQSVQLAGTATAPATLTVAPVSLAFGSQSAGTASTAQIVTITNSGSGAASLPTISITDAGGATSADFEAQYPCSEVIQAGKTCQVSVTFNPTAVGVPGTRTATMNVPGATPAAVALSGIATQPAITVITSLTFASQLVGTSGTPQPVTVKNSSSGAAAGALTFTGISIGGANKSDFAITTNQCEGASGAVAPGNSCTIEIAFQPQPAATCGDSPTRSATLQLQDNAPGSPQAVALSGPAADFCLASSNGLPVTAPIQPGQTATYSLEVASTGGFTGTANLSCMAPGGDEIGPCAIVTSPASNPASVQVTPTAAGQFTVNVPTVAAAAAPPWGAPRIGSNVQIFAATGAGLLCLLLLADVLSGKPLVAERRTKRLIHVLQMAALLAAFTLGMVACGSGGGGGSDPPPANPGTPPGTYTITVTATTTSGGSSTTRTASLTMTVE